MKESYQCPKCGQWVPEDAPEALCPRCVGALNLGSESGGSHAGAAAATPPPSAAELAPHFPQLEILELLGRGGMGVVYKVRQKELDRFAALKILPPGIGGDPAFAERFAREAKALAKLNHPGIVTIYDSGRTDGLYYFLMEFVDGVSLGRLMRGARVSAREALAVVPQICDALQYAHDQGIVHRDIKPENILLDRQGRVKVADFGLAKLVAGTQQPLTPALSPSDGEREAGRPGEGKTPVLTDAGKIMGTPAYMAPEQAEHPAEVDNRADIYALGVVFYQMLTGELPAQRLEPPSRKVQIDVRLDEVVLRALEKEPERRYQQVSQVKTAVETIVQTAIPATRKGEPIRQPQKPAERRAPVRRPGLALAILAGCFVLCLAALLGLLLKFRMEPPSEFLTQSKIQQLVESNQIAQATLTPSSPPTVAQILARYAQAKGEMAGADKTPTLIVKGVFTSRDGLRPMEAEAYLKAPDKWLMVLKDANGPVWRRAFDGAVGWEVSNWGRPDVDASTLLVARILSGIYRGDPLVALLPKLSLKGQEPISGGQAFVVEVELPGQPPRLWFDTQTGLLVRIEYSVGTNVMQMDCDDYRDVGGLKVPFKLRQTGSENWTIQCSEVKRDQPIEDSMFKRPATQ